jgi:cell wall-associated NlpC family hydrolase
VINPIDDFCIRKAIMALAEQSSDEEIGGCVTVYGEVITLPNLAQRRDRFFAIDLADHLENCRCIWHTHTADGRDGFSVEDIKSCRAIGSPYLLYTANKNWHYYDPDEIKPFVGRRWDWVYQNCYTLLQDWVFETFDHHMGDYYLSGESAWQNEDVGYVANLPNECFTRIDPANLQENDIILMQVGTNHPNHVGIYVDENKNLILHHLAGQLSQQSIYGSYWRKVTHSVWRFEEC